MAATSIWRVKGWLGKVVVYVENPDKTTNPAYYEKEDMSEKECQGLDDVIAYEVIGAFSLQQRSHSQKAKEVCAACKRSAGIDYEMIQRKRGK